MTLSQLTEPDWDVIVIGAGLGGGIAGRRLAEAGMSVLFLEQGPDMPRDAVNSIETDADDPDLRQKIGAWPTRIEARINGDVTHPWGGQGTGIGGTSVFYAAAMEQPERHDLDALPDMPHPTGGWPVGFDAFLPWFDKARAVMHVNGTPYHGGPPIQGLGIPRRLQPRDESMERAFIRAGLHPYRTHLGIRQLDGCQECIGRKCPLPCKMDGRSAGVEPALATGRAHVMTGATVQRLIGANRRIEGVLIRRNGTQQILRARQYVLAAGALGSPRLLMASASEAWPEGCANSSGLVGRGVMFHLTERLAIWPPRDAPPPAAAGPRKVFSMRDFYRDGQMRLGLVQSLGLQAGYGDILHVLRQTYLHHPLGRHFIGKQALRLPAHIAAWLLGTAHIFVGIVEDMPDDANRVIFDPARPETIIFDYTISDQLV
ncbi:MAG: GMC family oxidoreductase N-terminal domain-containing protein, partial [Paracoccus sp. (in: a-proteobacteria)]|nr:GMC family oxidoreductase N-terminal domain-containing protein [Paracoccus sp. (in: a-proteobacteria)]